MTGIHKRKGLIWFAILSSFLLVSCGETKVSEEGKSPWVSLSGKTQGTTYSVTLNDPKSVISQRMLDSVLHQFDLSLSTYIPESVVSTLNNSIDSVRVIDSSGYFARCYNLSQKIYDRTDGAFDPSVYPLVKAWGFYNDKLEVPSDAELATLVQSVGFEEGLLHSCRFLSVFEIIFFRKKPDFRLDFNAIAQGFSVDVLAEFLDSHGIKEYYVEIGGEINVKGKNPDGVAWRIGVDSPKQKKGTRELENVINISNKGIATSGNYRKFYEKDGVKYAHTINPKTGKPVQHSLLSATVVAETCAEADGYATAFMVIGVDATMRFLKDNPNEGLEVYLLYDDGKGGLARKMSKGFERYLK